MANKMLKLIQSDIIVLKIVIIILNILPSNLHVTAVICMPLIFKQIAVCSVAHRGTQSGFK